MTKGGGASAPMMSHPADEPGRTVGSTAAAPAPIPDAFIQSVKSANTHSVKIREQLAEGARLPRSVHLHSVHAFPNYRYAVVNDQRLIVDPHSRKIMQVVP